MSQKVLERFTAVVNNLGTAAANWGKRESSQNADQWDAASRAVTKEFLDLQRQLDEARALVDQLRLGRNEELAECQSELSGLKGENQRLKDESSRFERVAFTYETDMDKLHERVTELEAGLRAVHPIVCFARCMQIGGTYHHSEACKQAKALLAPAE